MVEPAETAVDDSDSANTPPRPLPLPVAAAAAVAAGLVLLLAFPPYGLWPLAPGGVGLLAAPVQRRRVRAGGGR
ncbi:apolipoprotein N-acyltransferase, partial [Micromonospora sp. CPCC 205371]|nr:apolipoprotein N-acyltransferase [Micromonospora sp. CPCC 205371]